nr:hypothetical protein [Tanacetum cinerariifolium]
MAYWSFLGVGTTFVIFQNVLRVYLHGYNLRTFFAISEHVALDLFFLLSLSRGSYIDSTVPISLESGILWPRGLWILRFPFAVWRFFRAIGSEELLVPKTGEIFKRIGEHMTGHGHCPFLHTNGAFEEVQEFFKEGFKDFIVGFNESWAGHRIRVIKSGFLIYEWRVFKSTGDKSGGLCTTISVLAGKLWQRGFRVASSHTGNHREDDFTPLETIRMFLGIIKSKSLSSSKGGLRAGWEAVLLVCWCSSLSLTSLSPLPACKAYGCESTLSLFRSLFTLGLAGDWLTFQKRPGDSVPSIFKASAWLFPERVLVCIKLSLLMAKAPLPERSLDIFVFNVLEGDTKVRPAGLGVGAFRARGTGVVVLICLSSKGKEIAGPSASGSKRKRSAGFSGEVPSLVFAGRPSKLFGPLASSVEGDDEARESHNTLGELCHLKTQREARSLFMEVLGVRDEVFNLKRDRSESTAVVAKLEAKLLCAKGRLSASETALARDLKDENDKLIKEIANLRELSHLVESSKKILESDVEALHSNYRQFEEKEAVMLATEASLNTYDTFSALLADLQGNALSVGRAQALKKAAAMDLGLRLEDVKDYDPDIVETYDKTIDDFYSVEFGFAQVSRALFPSSSQILWLCDGACVPAFWIVGHASLMAAISLLSSKTPKFILSLCSVSKAEWCLPITSLRTGSISLEDLG